MAKTASTAKDKQALRVALRQRRQALTPAQQSQAALSLVGQLTGLRRWRSAQTIALYLGNDGEIDTRPLAEQARNEGKHLLLPVLADAGELQFAHWQGHETLSNNRYNIPEPGPEAPRCQTAQIDIICLPLVGWDRSGGRLGMGGGYYDRTLAGIQGPLLIGLAHACQQVARVPREEFDVTLNYVATDTALVPCRDEET